ncbi:MAG: hypothetical protein NTW21_05235 [Verrucomicrobia bacterium]|nr:hypothetical protein [Verrucomicrobiota bacterium]
MTEQLVRTGIRHFRGGGPVAPDFHQHRCDREGDGTQNEPGRAENHETADQRNEGEDHVEFEPFADQDRTQQVADSLPRRPVMVHGTSPSLGKEFVCSKK